MADITMTYSAMSEAAGKIRSAESELIQAVANINSALSALGGGYSGSSSSSCSGTMRNICMRGFFSSYWPPLTTR